MKTIRTEATRARFLNALSEHANVREVCRRLGVTRNALYLWRSDDPAFARDWDAALALGADRLEDEAKRRAMAGSDYLMVFLLRALKPQTYRDRATVAVSAGQDPNRTLSISELKQRLEALRAQQDAKLTPPV
jgi:hypothetical protein